MKILLLLVILVVYSSSIIVVQTDSWQKAQGIWSSLISAQPQIAANPSQYFMCGFAFQQKKWDKILYNCNCGYRFVNWWFRYQCDWCKNTLFTMTKSFKGIFCNYVDWTKKIEQTVDSGSTDGNNWRVTMCPKGQFASKIAPKFGVQFQTDLGLNGLWLKCEPITYSESTQVQDNYRYPIDRVSKNVQGNVASGFYIKYESKGRLTGIKITFEGIPLISKLRIGYNLVTAPDAVPLIIDATQVINWGSTTVQKKIVFTKTHTIRNTWTTDQKYLKGYVMGSGITIEPLKLLSDTSVNESFSTYGQKTETFGFDKEIQTVFSSSQQIMAMVPSCKNYTITNTIRQKQMNVPYDAYVTFVNRYTGELITNVIVKGVWQGVLTSAVTTTIREVALDKC